MLTMNHMLEVNTLMSLKDGVFSSAESSALAGDVVLRWEIAQLKGRDVEEEARPSR